MGRWERGQRSHTFFFMPVGHIGNLNMERRGEEKVLGFGRILNVSEEVRLKRSVYLWLWWGWDGKGLGYYLRLKATAEPRVCGIHQQQRNSNT